MGELSRARLPPGSALARVLSLSAMLSPARFCSSLFTCLLSGTPGRGALGVRFGVISKPN